MARDDVAREWYNQYHEQGMTQAQIAEQFDASQSTVSRVIAAYDDGKETGRETGIEEGKESVEPTSFGREVLESALADKKEDDDEYSCGECGTGVEYMTENCPECNSGFNWDAL